VTQNNGWISTNLWSLNDDESIVKTTHIDDNTDPITSEYEQTNNECLISMPHKIFFAIITQ
jgi:hypothetical protein